MRRRGTGGIYSREDRPGFLWCYFTVNGKRAHECTWTNDQRKAEAYLQTRIETSQFPGTKPLDPTTARAEDLQRIYKQCTPASGWHRREAKWALERFGRFVEGRALKDLTEQDLRDYLLERLKGAEPITVERDLIPIRQALIFAWRAGLIEWSPQIASDFIYDAQVKRAVAESPIEHSDEVDGRPTVAGLLKGYFAQLQDQGSNVSKIRSQTKPLLRLLGDLSVDLVKPKLLEEYRTKRREEKTKRHAPPSQSTINRELGFLRAAMRRAEELEIIDRVPRFRMRAEARPRTDFWTLDDMKRVTGYLRTNDPSLADMIEFLFLTGWRKTEALKLAWDEIHWDEGHVMLQGDRVKNGDARVLPLAGKVREIIERRRADQRPDCPWVFHRDGHERLDLSRSWDTARELSGVSDKLAHGFRRTFARHQMLAGVNQSITMKLAGWKTTSMYERYLIVDEPLLGRSMEQSDRYLDSLAKPEPQEPDPDKTGGGA